jgi:hypothetical protein
MRKRRLCTLRFAPHSKHITGDKIEWKEMGGTCCTYGELIGSMSVPEGKRPLGAPRCRWEGIFKMEHSSKDLVFGLIWLRVPKKGENF